MPQYNEFGAIDLKIEHPKYGIIPFTASSDDPDGAAIYAAALAGEYGPIAPYVALPVQVPATPTTAQALQRIDADVDAIYAAAIGNRGPEYELAESEALAYQAASFSGTVPPSVASWQAASGMTAQAAALDIAAQGAAWRQLAQTLRAQRLQAKASVRAGEITSTLEAWSTFVTQVRASLV